MDVARDISRLFGRDPDATIKHVKDRAFNDRRYFMCAAPRPPACAACSRKGCLPALLLLAALGAVAACCRRGTHRPRALTPPPPPCPQLRQEAAGAGVARADAVGGGPEEDGGLVLEARQARLLDPRRHGARARRAPHAAGARAPGGPRPPPGLAGSGSAGGGEGVKRLSAGLLPRPTPPLRPYPYPLRPSAGAVHGQHRLWRADVLPLGLPLRRAGAAQTATRRPSRRRRRSVGGGSACRRLPSRCRPTCIHHS